MMNDYLVYKHTCPNNEVYIGITNNKPEKRWSNGEGYSGQWFYNAIKEFGWNNIKHEILFTDLSQEVAKKIEKELIIQYNSWVPGRGYNDIIGDGRSKSYPIRDTDTNKVYLNRKYCNIDSGVSIGQIGSSLEGRGAFAYRFEYCTSDNVSDDDIYIIGDSKRTKDSVVDMDKVKSLLCNRYAYIEKWDKGILTYEEGIKCDKLGEPKLDGVVWRVENCLNIKEFLLQILSDYLNENKKNADGVLFFDINTRQSLKINCKYTDIINILEILINEYCANKIVEIGFDRFEPYLYGVYVVKLNFDIDKFECRNYFMNNNNLIHTVD